MASPASGRAGQKVPHSRSRGRALRSFAEPAIEPVQGHRADNRVARQADRTEVAVTGSGRNDPDVGEMIPWANDEALIPTRWRVGTQCVVQLQVASEKVVPPSSDVEHSS